jgi:hypothetical protein
MDESSQEDLEYSIANLIIFFKGGISYTDFMQMPLPELKRWINHADKINKEYNKEMSKHSKRGI